MTAPPDPPNAQSELLRIDAEADAELDTVELARRSIELREQMEHRRQQSPEPRQWHRNTAAVVSVLAAVVSIISAGLSYWRGHEQEQHNRRIEFTALVQRMIALQDDPTDEYQVLARLAPAMIPDIAGDVSAPEYAIVARALSSGGDSERALGYARKARDLSRDNLSDLTWALRQLGWIQIQNGSLAEGMGTYESALGQFKQRGIDESLPWVVSDKTATYVDRGVVLAITGRCDEALSDYCAFTRLSPKVIFSGDRKIYESRAKDWTDILSRQCGARFDHLECK